jgi:hypothetical protein
VTVSLPNFARGPQQPVQVPASASTGIPVTLSNGAGITSASFQLRYNPALLNVTGAAVAPGMPVGSTVNVTFPSSGVMNVTFTSPTALAAGATRFVDLQASVPAVAGYRSKHLLDLTNISLNLGATPSVDDDAIHVVAYFGDVTANGSYSSQDGSRISRVSVGLDSGFEPYKLLDPVIVGDISGNGAISATDTARILQAAVGSATPDIPSLPVPAVSLISGGPDPKLSIPTDLHAAAGGQLSIPVHIDSIVDLTGSGLESADLVLYYDPSVLDVQSVSLGSLLAGRGGWNVASRIEVLAGRIFISVAGSNPLEGRFLGELVQLDAQVKQDAPAGASAINLAASSRDPSRFTQLNEGYLTLIPAPTDAANDPGVDGLLTVTSASGVGGMPSASIVDGQLLISGTDANDQIFASLLSNGLTRVRVGSKFLGDFAAPGGIAIDGLGGNDYIVVDPNLKAVIRTQDDDLIFAGTSAQLAEAADLSVGLLAGGEAVSNDAALLQLLSGWDDASDSPVAGNQLLRRRR